MQILEIELAQNDAWSGLAWLPVFVFCWQAKALGGRGGDMTTLDKSVKEKWLGQAQLLAFTESGKMCFVPQESRKCFIHSFF